VNEVISGVSNAMNILDVVVGDCMPGRRAIHQVNGSIGRVGPPDRRPTRSKACFKLGANRLAATESRSIRPFFQEIRFFFLTLPGLMIRENSHYSLEAWQIRCVEF
jgi:hypothetical protein